MTGTLDWIHKVRKDWVALPHQRTLAELLDRTPRGTVRACVAEPIRHYKTSTLIAAICKWLHDDPTLRIIYMTFTIERASEIGKDIRDACSRTGTKPAEGFNTIANWRNDRGGGVTCMSAQQSRLGADVDILVVDDPYENAIEADKPEIRQVVDETIAFYTMRLSRGGSCVVVMSRFHPDDAIGRRLRRVHQKWENIHAKAIQDDGTALAPEVRTLEELQKIRHELAEIDPTERLWYAQWQNEPRAPSGDLFRDPLRYHEVPTWPGFRTFYGLDMSYSQAKISDWSAIVAMRAWGSQAYVLDVERFKLDVRLIGERLALSRDRFGEGPIFSYVSGPEKGIVEVLAERGLGVSPMPARYNKLVRAERTIARVNRGEVLFPHTAKWVESFLGRLSAFRGVDGDDDDEVDALVSACDGGLFSAVAGEPTRAFGSRRF
jgi:predicted phage terminase large subunit-like protein